MGSKTDESDNSACSAPTTLQKGGRSSSSSSSSSGRGRLCQVGLSNSSANELAYIVGNTDKGQTTC
jgi:hypothetical protein